MKIIKWEACWTQNLLKYLIVLISKAEVKIRKWVSSLYLWSLNSSVKFSFPVFRLEVPSEAASWPPNQNPTQSWSRAHSFNLPAPLSNYFLTTHCAYFFLFFNTSSDFLLSEDQRRLFTNNLGRLWPTQQSGLCSQKFLTWITIGQKVLRHNSLRNTKHTKMSQ